MFSSVSATGAGSQSLSAAALIRAQRVQSSRAQLAWLVAVPAPNSATVS
jgi:hypothetical protein